MTAANRSVLPEARALDHERWELLEQLEEWLETPMLLLGFVWLVLLVIELVRGLSPLLEGVSLVIWGLFVLDFAVKFSLAPNKRDYLRSNWLTALALLVPALRVFRIVRVVQLARAARGLRLFRFVTSLNRGIRALRATMGRRGFGYVATLTAGVTLVGAAAMYASEQEAPGGPGLRSYSDALWWTAMLMTTLGSEYWPRTAEGRVLCFMLALYAFAVFGYVTATLATFFVGRDAEDEDAELASASSIDALKEEIQALRAEVRALAPGDAEG
jgi:voltage-gated potassium channel